MLNQKITYKRFGERAILIEWEARINEQILENILQFKNAIFSLQQKKLSDAIVGYNSLTLVYADFVVNFSDEVQTLKNLYQNLSQSLQADRYIWEIPVCYNIEFGVDLEELSQEKGISVQKIIELHTKPLYTVYFIGFLPGFLYLGGLKAELHTPRKATPRLHVEQGSVAIGGVQTGIYPQDSAGGWNIIGKTLVSFFNPAKELPCFAKSGDKIKFVAVSLEEFMQFSQSDCQPQKTLYNA